MGDMEIPDELIDQLLGEYQSGAVDRPGGVDQPAAAAFDRAGGRRRAGAASRLPAGGRAAGDRPNRRNGTTSKTLRTVDGPVAVELPRDRDASFEPRIVPKHARSFDGFDEQILALYAGGMTTREIQRHLREIGRASCRERV